MRIAVVLGRVLLGLVYAHRGRFAPLFSFNAAPTAG